MPPRVDCDDASSARTQVGESLRARGARLCRESRRLRAESRALSDLARGVAHHGSEAARGALAARAASDELAARD